MKDFVAPAKERPGQLNVANAGVTSTPEQFDAIIRNDTERNSKIVRDAGINAN